MRSGSNMGNIYRSDTRTIGSRGANTPLSSVTKNVERVCGLSVEHYATPCSEGRVARWTVDCLNRVP